MKKRILLTSILALTALALVGCDNTSSQTSSSSTTDTTNSSSSSSSSSSSTPAEEHTFAIRYSGTAMVNYELTLAALFDGGLLPPAEQEKVVYTTTTPDLIEITGRSVSLKAAGEGHISASYEKEGVTYTAEETITIEESENIETIAEARAKAVEYEYVETTVQGVITATNGRSAYIEDGTGGMYIYNWYFETGDDACDSSYNWILGASVEIHAYVTSWYGAPQLTGSYKDDNDNYIDLVGKYARKISREFTLPEPTVLDENALKGLTPENNSGRLYTFEADYVSGNMITTDDSEITMKIGSTQFKIIFSSRDSQLASLVSKWNASFIKPGDTLRITAPYYGDNNGAQFHMFSQGTSFENLDVSDFNVLTEGTALVDQTLTLRSYFQGEEVFGVTYEATTGADLVTINGSSVTLNGEGDVTISATYVVGEETYTATVSFTIIDVVSISEIDESGRYYVTTGTVVGENTDGILIHDGTAGILCFAGDLVGEFNIGDVVQVSGTTQTYNSMLQFTYSDVQVELIDGTPADPATTPLTADIVNSWNFDRDYVNPTTAVQKYSWIGTAGKDGSYWTLNIPGANKALEPLYLDETDYPITAGLNYEVEGYLIGGQSAFAGFMITSLTETEEEPPLPDGTIEATIAEITQEGEVYHTKGQVVAKNDRSVIIHDGTAGIMVFGSNSVEGLRIGDSVEVLGSTSSYNGLLQFSNPTVTTTTETFTVPEAVDLTSEIVDSWSAGSLTSADVQKYKWTAVAAKTNGFWTLNLAGNETLIEPLYLVEEDFPLAEGRTYEVEAYFAGYSTSNQYAGVLITGLTQTATPDLTGITIQAPSTSVAIDGTLQLKAVANPVGAELGEVTWKSSDDAVATVDQTGLVTGVKVAESVTITATSVADPEISGSVTLKVTAEAMEATITFDDSFNTGFTTLTEDEWVKTVDGVTLHVQKNSSTSDIAIDGDALTYIDPVRIYKNHSLTITAPEGRMIRGIAVVSPSGDNAFVSDTVSSSVGTVGPDSVTLDEPVNEITLTALAQFRLNSITIYFA